MRSNSPVALGDKARDRISGFEGIATARTEFLNGCVRISLSPTVDEKGNAREDRWYDIEQVEVLERAVTEFAPPPPLTAKGGDRPDHPSRTYG